MRGADKRSGELFSYVDLETRVRQDHPLRPIREMANAALAVLSGDFATLYAGTGRYDRRCKHRRLPCARAMIQPPLGEADAGRSAFTGDLMPVEWDFLRGPLPVVRAALIESFEKYARHKRSLKVWISSNPLLTLLHHAEDEALEPDQYVGERLVGLYETYSLEEALAAMELLLAHARSWRPESQVERDAQHSILEEDEDPPFFVYVLGDSIHEFSRRSIVPG